MPINPNNPTGTTDPNGPIYKPPTTTSTDGGTSAPTQSTTVAAVDQTQPSAGEGPQAQGVGTGFANIQSLLSANAPQVQAQAQGLVNNAYSQGQSASPTPGAAGNNGGTPYSDAQLGAAKKASDYSKGLNSYGGLAQTLQDAYKGQSYTSGQNQLDTLLTGAAGQDAFKSAQATYGGLYDTLLNAPSTAPNNSVKAVQGTATGIAAAKQSRADQSETPKERIKSKKLPQGGY